MVNMGCFSEMSEDELMFIDGGTVWGAIAGACTIIAGILGVAGGILLLVAPDPTFASKIGGLSAIASGVMLIGQGVVQIGNNVDTTTITA